MNEELDEFEDSICDPCTECAGAGTLTVPTSASMEEIWCYACGGAKTKRDACGYPMILSVRKYDPPYLFGGKPHERSKP